MKLIEVKCLWVFFNKKKTSTLYSNFILSRVRGSNKDGRYVFLAVS